MEESLKQKVNSLIVSLRNFYANQGKIDILNNIHNDPLIITSGKMRSTKEQIGYIYDEYSRDKTNLTGSYLGLRRYMIDLFKIYNIKPSKDTVYEVFLKAYGDDEKLTIELYNRGLYHVGGNAVDVRSEGVTYPYAQDIANNYTEAEFSDLIAQAFIHKVGEQGGLHLHISFR